MANLTFLKKQDFKWVNTEELISMLNVFKRTAESAAYRCLDMDTQLNSIVDFVESIRRFAEFLLKTAVPPPTPQELCIENSVTNVKNASERNLGQPSSKQVIAQPGASGTSNVPKYGIDAATEMDGVVGVNNGGWTNNRAPSPEDNNVPNDSWERVEECPSVKNMQSITSTNTGNRTPKVVSGHQTPRTQPSYQTNNQSYIKKPKSKKGNKTEQASCSTSTKKPVVKSCGTNCPCQSADVDSYQGKSRRPPEKSRGGGGGRGGIPPREKRQRSSPPCAKGPREPRNNENWTPMMVQGTTVKDDFPSVTYFPNRRELNIPGMKIFDFPPKCATGPPPYKQLHPQTLIPINSTQKKTKKKKNVKTFTDTSC
ncbi:uncharacterized protein LOC110842759 [Folsomia candida]|nr:uncharacterized protein LOC110842759 [Folsomia candida]